MTPPSRLSHTALERRTTSLPSRPLEGTERGRAQPSVCTLDKNKHTALTCTDQGDNNHLGSVRHRPYATPHRQDNIVQSGDDKYDDHRPDTARQDESTILPAMDGIHNEGLDLEAIQAGRNHDPNDRDRGPHSSRQRGNQRPKGGHQLPYDALGN
jgi:hypothetical protein